MLELQYFQQVNSPEVSPTVRDLFPRAQALRSSSARSFKIIPVDSKGMFSKIIFRAEILVKPVEAPVRRCGGRGERSGWFVSFEVGSPLSARAAVIRRQKPSPWGMWRTETGPYRKRSCFPKGCALLSGSRSQQAAGAARNGPALAFRHVPASAGKNFHKSRHGTVALSPPRSLLEPCC